MVKGNMVVYLPVYIRIRHMKKNSLIITRLDLPIALS